MRRASIGLVFAAMATASPSWGQGSPAEEPSPGNVADAASMKARADELVRQRNPGEALPLYDAAYRLSRDPAILYNRARAYGEVGKYARALDDLDAFKRDAPAALAARVQNLDALHRYVSSHVATLEIAVSEPDAVVTVSGESLGVSPVGKKRVDAGQVRIDVVKAGFFPFRKDVTLPGGASSVIEVALIAKENRAMLVVSCPVVGAQVAIDGEVRGTAPAEVILAAGSHQVTVTHPDHETSSRQVTLEGGQRGEISIPLAKASSVFGKWWFWTIVGGVAVGGTATVLLVARERSPDSGTIPPGQIPIGALRF